MSDMVIVLDSSNGDKVGEVPLTSWDEIDRWLEEMTKLHRDRDALPAYRRIEILKKTKIAIEARREEFALLIATEGGKPLKDARVETDRAIAGVELAIGELLAERGEQIPMDLTESGAGRVAFTFREPIGPVVAVSAFNHPLNLIVHQVIPAVATGCPVIVKPAEDTPLCARLLVELLHEAGLSKEWCRFALCDIPVAEKMVTDPRVGFFSFIGSAKVGWMLRSKLAPGTRYALEHGGAAPVLIDRNAAFADMIPALVKGGYYHSGQVCVSVQRVFVPRATLDAFSEELAAHVEVLKVGDAKTEGTDCGPLIRTGEVDRVADWVARSSGQVVTGGNRLSERFYAPTILREPGPDDDVSSNEIFGPVVCLYGYDDVADALAQANALPYAFQAAVFTDSMAFARRAVLEFDASAVMVNDHTAFRVDWMPFAGRRQSGYGTGGIGYTMRDLTQEKLAVMKF
ncbi:MAG: aldehyde dehydrogenase family protein [Pacificimonas sp.]